MRPAVEAVRICPTGYGLHEVQHDIGGQILGFVLISRFSEAEVEDLFHVGLGNVLHEAVIFRLIHWVSHSLRRYSVGKADLVAEIFEKIFKRVNCCLVAVPPHF